LSSARLLLSQLRLDWMCWNGFKFEILSPIATSSTRQSVLKFGMPL